MQIGLYLLHRFGQTSVDVSNLPHAGATSAEIQKALDIVFTTTGAIALLIITIAGFRYILSRGDPQATAQAKDAILYAAVGLVISVISFSIVNYVVQHVL